MNEIREMAQTAIHQINRRADEILEEMAWAHFEAMQRFDAEDERHEYEDAVADGMAPHTSLEAWWESLDFDEQWEWDYLYGRYQYGPEGDFAIPRGDPFSMAVMHFLFGRDSYQKQPSCPYCDCPVHESGTCMHESIDNLRF